MPTAPPLYDPAGYVSATPSTWPQPIPPATLYQPGMAWTMSGPGTVEGQTVAAGDLLFVVHRDRLYGEFGYGDGTFGSTPDQDWGYADVTFVAWYASYPGPDQPPYPYSGCQFGDTGWWVIIDAFYLDATGSRTYGLDNYGDQVYGDVGGATARWVDVTAGFVDVTIDRGDQNGAPQIDAAEIEINWYDPDFARVDLSPPGSYYRPSVGFPLRVSFYDRDWGWHPRIVGEIESIVDPVIARTGGDPRFVTIHAYGHVMDVARTLPQWQRPAEPASTRFAALMSAAGWRYGTDPLVYPPDVALHADPDPENVSARSELDRTALSAGWVFDTDLRGRPRLRVWPLEAVGAPLAVVDCDPATGLVATLITFVADESQLINIAHGTNTQDPPIVVTATDSTSVAVYGGRDTAAGIDLAFATAADGQRLVDRIVRRYGRIVTHVDPLTVDSLVDPGWLAALADIDTGQALTITRNHPVPYTLASIVVALTETITPGRIEATVYTTTTTPTI